MHEYLLKLNQLLNTNPLEHGSLTILVVAIIGLIIGSYLNVVIYRGSSKYITSNYKGKLNVFTPKHSFCPDCLHPLAWIENIPVISWVIQGAKCKHCKAPISIQYPLVEATNTLGWTFLWINCQSISQFITYAIFLSILIAVTVIDIKTLKIPNKITLSAIVILLALSLATSGVSEASQKALAVLGATILGYSLAELGKFLFGKKTVKLKTLTPFILDQKNQTLTIQEEGKSLEESEPMPTNELFIRSSDAITIGGEIDDVEGKKSCEQYSITIESSQTVLERKTKDNPPVKEPLLKDKPITGKIKEITMPQEALGMGDVKLLMLIAAAVGYPNFVYAMTLGAIAGLIYALILRIGAITRKTNAPSVIAFGPWLSLGSLIVLFNEVLQRQ